MKESWIGKMPDGNSGIRKITALVWEMLMSEQKEVGNSSSLTCNQVGWVVADQDGVWYNYIKLGYRLKEEAGMWFAAIAINLVVAKPFGGVIGAMVDGVNRSTSFAKLFKHPLG